MLGRGGAGGFLSGTAGARPPRHPRQERNVPAWGPGGHAEGGRTGSERLGPVGVLKRSVLAAPLTLLTDGLSSAGSNTAWSHSIPVFENSFLVQRGCNRDPKAVPKQAQ